jgi:PAS domain S-box-containing protein
LSSADSFAPSSGPSGEGGAPDRRIPARRRRWLVLVFTGIYFVLLAAPALLLDRQYAIQRDIDAYLAGEDSWTVYRAELEYRAALNMLSLAAATDAAATRAAVQTAIDVLYNRKEVLKGPFIEGQFSPLSNYAVAIQALDTAMLEVDAILKDETGERVSPSGIAALRAALERVERPLGNLISDVMTQSARDRDEIRARAETEMSWNGAATAALIAASLVYVGVLAWHVRELTKAGDGLRRLADAVRQSETRLRLIADNLPMLISYVEADRHVRFVNRTGEIWGAQPAEDIIGKSMAWLLGRDSYRAVAEHILQAAAGNVRQFEGPLVFPDGERRVVEASFIPDFAPDAAPRTVAGRTVRGCFIVMIDITARRESEEQLRQALKMEAVGRLTGGVAHDFNNLLGVIVGNLDLAERDLTGRPKERALIGRALGAAERGAALTQRLLAFSRRQMLLPRLTDVNRLVVDMADTLLRTLGETIEITAIPARDPCFAHVDANQLEAAILNLAVNARDAMPTGGRLTIATTAIALDDETARASDVAPGDYVLIAVTDTGAGMAPDIAGRAFEPFFTTKEVGKGSGLGLSMVFGFVKQSGGHVEIDSEVDFGTTVRLYLPRAAAKGKGGDRSADVEIDAAPPSGQGRLVLVVEDNRDMLTYSTAALNRLGYRTVTAEDATTALTVLERMPEVSILFTDIVLPGGMDGLALAREAQRRNPELKLLFTSGFAQTGAQGSGLGGGQGGTALPPDTELLSKPFRVAELSRHLDRLVGAAAD